MFPPKVTREKPRNDNENRRSLYYTIPKKSTEPKKSAEIPKVYFSSHR